MVGAGRPPSDKNASDDRNMAVGRRLRMLLVRRPVTRAFGSRPHEHRRGRDAGPIPRCIEGRDLLIQDLKRSRAADAHPRAGTTGGAYSMSPRSNPKIFGPPPIQAELPMIAVPPSLPPTTELATKAQLVARHPHLLSVNRVTWALRCRAVNGLSAAVFDSPCGELLIHEPSFLAWFLGLSGRAKPRSSRRAGAG